MNKAMKNPDLTADKSGLFAFVKVLGKSLWKVDFQQPL